MTNQVIDVEILNHEFAVDISFDFIPGRPAVLDRAPEDCTPEEPYELIIGAIFLVNSGINLTYLYDDIGETIEELLMTSYTNWQEGGCSDAGAYS